MQAWANTCQAVAAEVDLLHGALHICLDPEPLTQRQFGAPVILPLPAGPTIELEDRVQSFALPIPREEEEEEEEEEEGNSCKNKCSNKRKTSGYFRFERWLIVSSQQSNQRSN